MSADEVRQRTQQAWDLFYSVTSIWRRSTIVSTVRERLAFVLISKLYRQMYANTGNRDRQRPRVPLDQVGTMAGEASSTGVCGDSDARPSGSASERRQIRSEPPQRSTFVLKPREAFRGGSIGLAMPLEPGTILGSYHVTAKIGEGAATKT